MLSHFSVDSLWPRGLQPIRLLCPWNSPGKNTGVGCYLLFQIVPTQGSIQRVLWLLHCRQGSLPLSHQGSPEQTSKTQDQWWDFEDIAMFTGFSMVNTNYCVMFWRGSLLRIVSICRNSSYNLEKHIGMIIDEISWYLRFVCEYRSVSGERGRGPGRGDGWSGVPLCWWLLSLDVGRVRVSFSTSVCLTSSITKSLISNR